MSAAFSWSLQRWCSSQPRAQNTPHCIKYMVCIFLFLVRFQLQADLSDKYFAVTQLFSTTRVSSDTPESHAAG